MEIIFRKMMNMEIEMCTYRRNTIYGMSRRHFSDKINILYFLRSLQVHSVHIHDLIFGFNCVSESELFIGSARSVRSSGQR